MTVRAIHNQTSHAGAIGLALLALLAAFAAVAAQDPTERIVIDVAKTHLNSLKNLTPTVQNRAREARSAIEILHLQYDAILLMGRGAKREELIALYDHGRKDVVATLANLDIALNELEPAYESVRKFLEDYDDYRSLEAYKLLEQRALVAGAAVINGRKLTRPPKLPDTLPDEKQPDIVITKQEAPRKTEINKQNDFLVTVHNNRVYTPATATIEAGIGSGPGKILGPTKQQVTLEPNETKTILFQYKLTDEGQIKLGAHVLP